MRIELGNAVYNWRKNHPRCKFCKYYHKYSREACGQFFTFEECEAKDKSVMGRANWPRPFCTCFDLYFEIKDVASNGK